MPFPSTTATMDQTKELLEMPREFLKDGRQFVTRCSKRTSTCLPVWPSRLLPLQTSLGLSRNGAQRSV